MIILDTDVRAADEAGDCAGCDEKGLTQRRQDAEAQRKNEPRRTRRARRDLRVIVSNHGLLLYISLILKNG